MLAWKLTGVLLVERAVRSSLGSVLQVAFVVEPAGALLQSALRMAVLRWKNSEVSLSFDEVSMRLLIRRLVQTCEMRPSWLVRVAGRRCLVWRVLELWFRQQGGICVAVRCSVVALHCPGARKCLVEVEECRLGVQGVRC